MLSASKLEHNMFVIFVLDFSSCSR